MEFGLSLINYAESRHYKASFDIILRIFGLFFRRKSRHGKNEDVKKTVDNFIVRCRLCLEANGGHFVCK